MKIYLHEIKDVETNLEFTQEEKWVAQAVARVDEQSSDLTAAEANALARRSTARPVHAELSLRKVDDVVVVSGDINTHLELICSRCAAYYQHPCNIHFSGLFCKDPVMAGVAHLQRSAQHEGGVAKPAGQNKGFARHAHDYASDEAMAEGKDLDITYLSEDFIDLADVLTEQLQLQVPFQPLCREACKGICSNCGADLNQGRCACAKITTSHPFSVLKDLKL